MMTTTPDQSFFTPSKNFFGAAATPAAANHSAFGGFETDASALSMAGIDRLDDFDMGSDDDNEPINASNSQSSLPFRTSPGPFHASRRSAASPSGRVSTEISQSPNRVRSMEPLFGNTGSMRLSKSSSFFKDMESVAIGSVSQVLPATPADRFQFDLLQEKFDDSMASSPGAAAVNLFPMKSTRDAPISNEAAASTLMQTPPNRGSPLKSARMQPKQVQSTGKSSEKGAMQAGYGKLGLRQREQMLDELKKENFSLKLRIYYLEEQIDKMGPEYQKEIFIENSKLKAEVERLRSELEQSKIDLLTLQEDYESGDLKGDAAEAYQQQIQELNSDLEQHRHALNRAEESLSGLRAERDSLAQRTAALEDAVKTKDSELEDQFQRFEQVIVEKDQELETIKLDSEIKIEELTNKLEELAQNNNLGDKVQELENLLENEREHSQRQLTTLEEELQGEIQNHQAKYTELQKILEKARDELREQHSLASSKDGESQQLVHQLHEIRADRDRLEDQCQTQFNELRAVTSRFDKLREERDALRANLQDNASSSELAKELAGLREKYEKTRDDNTSLRTNMKADLAKRNEMYDRLKQSYNQVMEEKEDLTLRLQQKEHELEKVMETMKHELARMKDEHSSSGDLKEQIENLRNSLAAAIEAKTDLEMSNSSKQADIDTLRKELARKDNDFQEVIVKMKLEYGTEIARIKSTQERERSFGSNADDELLVLRAKVAQLEEEHVDIQQLRQLESDRLVSEIQSLKQQQETINATSKNMIENLNDEVAQKVNILTSKDTELNQLRIELEQTKASNELLSEQLRHIEHSRDDAVRQGSDREQQLAQSLKNTQMDFLALQDDLKNLADKYEVVLSEQDELVTERNTAQAELENLREHVEQLQHHGQLLLSERSSFATRNDTLEKEMDALKGKLQTVDIEKEALVMELNQVKGRIANMSSSENTDLAYLEESMEQLRSQVKGLNMQVGDKDREIDMLRREVSEKSKEVMNVTETFKQREEILKSSISETARELEHYKSSYQKAVRQVDSDSSFRREESLKYQERLSETERELQSKVREMFSAKEEAQSLLLKVKHSENVAKQQAHHIEELKKQLLEGSSNVSNDTLAHLQNQLASSQGKLLDAQLSVSNLTTELALVKDQCEVMTRKLRDTHTTLLEKENQMTSLELRAIEAEEKVKTWEGKWRKESEVRVEREKQIFSEMESAPEKMRKFVEDERHRARKHLETEREKWRKEKEEDEIRTIEMMDDMKARLNRAQVRVDELNVELHEKSSELLLLRTELDRQQPSQRGVRGSEVERVLKEVDHVREKYSRLKVEYSSKDRMLSEASDKLERLHRENHRLVESLASAEELKLKAESTTLDVQSDLRDKEYELRELRQRILDLRNEVDKEQEFTHVTEKQYKDQLSERNRLLVVIFDYVSSVLAKEQVPISNNPDAVTKNFGHFYERLLTKLRQVGKLCQSFEERTKAVENKGLKEFRILSTKLDTRIKQLEKFESIVRTASSYQKKLKDACVKKQAELEEEKARTAALSRKVQELEGSSRRVRSETDASDERVLALERKLKETQNNYSELKSRALAGDESRAMELERQLQDLENTLFMERQGASDRVSELIDNIKKLERQVDMLNKKNRQLNDWVAENKQQLAKSSSMSNDTKSTKLVEINEQLRKDISLKNHAIETERERYQKLKGQHTSFMNEYEKLKAQLGKREKLITKALTRLEGLNERRDAIEVAILREAAEDIGEYLKSTQTPHKSSRS